MRSRNRTIIFSLVGLVLILSGCGPTNEEIINQFKPQFAELRTELQAVAAALPESASEQPAAQPLNPAPDYKEGTYGEVRNTDIVMYDHLLDPDLDLGDNQLDLTLSNYVIMYLKMTGPKSTWSPSTLKKRAPEGRAEEFEQALQVRYLGVARVVKYEPPVAVSKDSFSGGYTEVDGFLVDMETQQVLCSFSIAARPNELVSYKYKEGEDPVKALAEFAHSTLWENARQAFVKKMGEMCGGTFVIE